MNLSKNDRFSVWSLGNRSLLFQIHPYLFFTTICRCRISNFTSAPASNKRRKVSISEYLSNVPDRRKFLKPSSSNTTCTLYQRDKTAIMSSRLRSSKQNTSSFHEVYERRDKAYSSISDKIIEMGPYRDRGETLSMMINALGDLIA